MRMFVVAALLASMVAGSASAFANAAAADTTPRLQRVLLLPVAGRVSIVLEMSGPPASVTSRRISGDLVEVDAGPARVEHPQALTAPSTTPFVTTVLIDGTAAAGNAPPALRARITLREPTRSTVRIEGARVYIDLLGADASPTSAPSQARAISTRTRAAGATTTAAAAAPSRPDDQGLEQLRVSLDRFGELLPFLTSAANAPTPQVLAALAAPTASLDRDVTALPGTARLRPAEGLLASATAAAVKAVDVDYRGDRLEQVRQAAIFLEQARREIALPDSRK